MTSLKEFALAIFPMLLLYIGLAFISAYISINISFLAGVSLWLGITILSPKIVEAWFKFVSDCI